MDLEKPTYWELIFTQSKVNGGLYVGDLIPPMAWDWPRHTWLQNRLAEIKRRAGDGE